MTLYQMSCIMVLAAAIPLHAMQKRGRHPKTPILHLTTLPYNGTEKDPKNKELLEELNQGLWGIFIGSNYGSDVDKKYIVHADKFYQTGITCLQKIQPTLNKKQIKFDNDQLGHSPAFVHSCLKSLVMHGEHELLSSFLPVLPHDIAYVYASSNNNTRHTLLDVAEIMEHLQGTGASLDSAQKVKNMIIDEGGKCLIVGQKRALLRAVLRSSVSKGKRKKIMKGSSSEEVTHPINQDEKVKSSNASANHSELYDSNSDKPLYPSLDFLNYEAPLYQNLDSDDGQVERAQKVQKMNPEGEDDASKWDSEAFEQLKKVIQQLNQGILEPLFDIGLSPDSNQNGDNE